MLIDIIAPGGRCQTEDLSDSLSLLNDWGVTPRHVETLLSDHVIYAAPDNARLDNLTDALEGPSELLWALRGGCGTSRLMSSLSNLSKPSREKVVIGFSDITALLLFVYKAWGWKPIHGPVLRGLTSGGVTEDIKQIMHQLIVERSAKIECDMTKVNQFEGGSLSGELVGGNLAVIQRSIGTPWQIETKERIVFFEDIHEPPYRVAEMLDHLIHAGCLSSPKAVVFGQFTPGNTAADSNFGRDLDVVINEFAERIHVPIFKGLKVGHVRENYPVQIGQVASVMSHNSGAKFQQKLVI